MKLRISSSDRTLLQKDVLRFAPAWGLYSLFLFMAVLLSLDSSDHYWFVRDMESFINTMAILNLLYAPLVAQLLFGDLYNSRMCNALHALPVKRETWFAIHITAGILFSLVPNLIMGIGAMALLGQEWFVGLTWFLQVSLQYVAFFGLAVVAVFCSGNRFAQIVVYGMLNFLAGIVYWMVDTLYEPLLYGIWLDLEWFSYLMPVYAMAENSDILEIARISEQTPAGDTVYTGITVAAGDAYWAVLPYALVGIAFMAVALMLYRKRKLEVAGDFLAVTRLEPVFQVLFTVCAGVAFNLACDIFGVGSGGARYAFLVLGLVTGFFVCRMLLRRSLRVFDRKSWLQLAAIGTVLGLSLVLTRMDPLGITRWIPQVDEVVSVRLQNGSYWSAYHPNLELTEPEDVETILRIHQYVLENRDTEEVRDMVGYASEKELLERTDDSVEFSPYTDSYFCLEYTLTDGRVKSRFYQIYTGTEEGQMLNRFYTRPECVLETEDVAGFLNQFNSVEVDEVVFTGSQMEELFQCILLDCAEGTMSQTWDYHVDDMTAYWVRFRCKSYLADGNSHFSLDVYESCTHTVQWLQDHGLLTEREKYY